MRESEKHLPRITSVRPIEEFRVHLRFSDGTERQVDLEPYLRGPIFEPIRQNLAAFREVAVDPELGTIVWPNGADLDPDVLHAGGTPEWARKKEVG